MSGEVVERRYRKRIPEEHRSSMDTRIQWLWMQKFGTVQTIWANTDDVLDKTACTVFLQAAMAKDLNSIATIFQRLEGGTQVDTDVADGDLVI